MLIISNAFNANVKDAFISNFDFGDVGENLILAWSRFLGNIKDNIKDSSKENSNYKLGKINMCEM